MFSRLRSIFLLSLIAVVPAAAQDQVQAELVSAQTSVQPGETFMAALRLEHIPKWHTYWINPGTGYPTSVAWELPEGWTAGDIQWPAPLIIRDSHGTITGNGYEYVTYLPIPITAPADLEVGGNVTLKGHADWLMCADVCIPGDTAVELTLPVVAESADFDSSHASGIREALESLASLPDEVTAVATRDEDRIRLRLEGLPTPISEPWFFASDAFVQYDQPQEVLANADGILELSLAVAEYYDGDGERLVGVLRQANTWDAAGRAAGLNIDLAFGETAGQVGVTSAPAAAPATGSLMATLALAWVGGLILNLMPCVFPVLGIKIMGFVQQAGEDRRKVALHGWVFSLGVLASFWVLAGLLAVLRAGGDQLGWGFQLQSPGFVFVLAAVMLVFAMAMSGVFEFGLSATGVGANLQAKEGLSGSFFTGVLATVVATPCSAPFLAPALGAALALPMVESFAVFTAIAVGLSTPYLLLSLFPAAVKILPRPGAWMETFKQAMAFPLYATVAYLVWVLVGQTTESGSLMVMFGLTVVAVGVWLYGRYTAPGQKIGARRFGFGSGFVVLVLGLAIGWPRAPEPDALVWEKWSPAAVAAAQAEGRPIYVDFTARWCATCQTNKKIVFGSDEVQHVFRDRDIAMLKADWTNRDATITEELAKWGRSAVPFNLVYLPGNPEPIILPELLTPGMVLDALN